MPYNPEDMNLIPITYTKKLGVFVLPVLGRQTRGVQSLGGLTA